MAGVYWTGQDGKTYVKADGFKGGAVTPITIQEGNQLQADLLNGLKKIEDPALVPLGASTDTPSNFTTGGETKVDPNVALRGQLRSEIAAKGLDVDTIYNALFGGLDENVRSRSAELESEYGGQFKKAGDTYAAAIPEIETSYAAIGSENSTDNSDAKTGAKKGFDETTATIGKNKADDETKLGQYSKEQRAKIAADKDAASRNVARAGETEDVDALRGMRNDLETNLSNAQVTKASLGSNGQARQELSSLTADNGRSSAAINALDAIVKSSMSGAVKEAAVKAVTDNAGLSEEDKKKVQAQYGNVYAEQAAL